MIRRAGMGVRRVGLVGGSDRTLSTGLRGAVLFWIGVGALTGIVALGDLYRSGKLGSAWRTSWPKGLFFSLLVLGLIVLLLLWKLPHWQVARSKSVTNANRFDRENEARKTLAQIVGGVFLLASLYSSTRTLELSRQNQDLVRQGQITDRFTKAIEQLGTGDVGGTSKLEVRLGGIYALERIARDSDRDHPVVMEVLTAYVREHAPVKTDSEADAPQKSAGTKKKPLGADIQAILTVIRRREAKYDRGVLDLSNAYLSGANLHVTYLSGADLSGADLHGAYLIGAYLRGAVLFEVKGLTQDQVNSARDDSHMELPESLKTPSSRPKY